MASKDKDKDKDAVFPKFQFKMKLDMKEVTKKMEEFEKNVQKNVQKTIQGVGQTLKVKKPKKRDPLSAEKIAPEEERRSDEELMRTIPAEYFNEGFDVATDTLQRLPYDLDDKYLNELIKEKEHALDVVNGRLLSRVMNSYSSFVQAMTQIHELGVGLQKSTIMCKNGRMNLAAVKKELTAGGMTILHTFRVRYGHAQVMQDLMTIKAILGMQQQLSSFLSQGDYAKTIRMCLECRNTVNKAPKFAVVQELDGTLNVIYNTVQERLDKALMDACRTFSPLSYERVFNAHKLLGRIPRISERLQSCFVDPIDKETKRIVLSLALLSEDNARRPEIVSKMSLKDLCSVIKDDYVNCLLTVLEYLCGVMYSHFEMSKWHQEHQGSEDSKFYTDIVAALKNLKKTMWEVMQQQVSTMLQILNFTSFKVDDFAKILDGVTQFLEIGEEFSGTQSHNLFKTVKQQSKMYFEVFHRTHVEDLRTMLENEVWDRCPVNPEFTVRDIKDFHAVIKSGSNASREKHSGQDARFLAIRANGNPFSKMIQYQRKNMENQASAAKGEDSDNEESSELMAEYIEEEVDTPTRKPRENRPQETKTGPLLTSTTITVVRYFGKYLNLMKVLQPFIAYEVFIGITQIFEYYIFTMFTFFGAPPAGAPNTKDVMFPRDPKLRAFLQKLKDKFAPSSTRDLASQVMQGMGVQEQQPIKEDLVKVRWIPARISSVGTEIASPRSLFGISYREVGTESMMFLVDGMLAAKNMMQPLVPATALKDFTSFYADEVNVVPDLRLFMYRSLCSGLVQLDDRLISEILMVRFDVVGNVPTQKSPYVNMMLKEFNQFGSRIDNQVSPSVKLALWDQAIQRAMELLVEGFSRVRKCTAEGRSIMMQDVNALQTGLEKVSPIRNTPHINKYVINYINGFYAALGIDQEIVDWAASHQEYTLDQVKSLVDLAANQPNAPKSSRPKIITQIEEARSGGSRRPIGSSILDEVRKTARDRTITM